MALLFVAPNMLPTPSLVQAEEHEEEEVSCEDVEIPPDPSWSESDSWTEGRCVVANQCGGEREFRQGSWSRGESYQLEFDYDENGCATNPRWELTDSWDTGTEYSESSTQPCGTYKQCKGSTDWVRQGGDSYPVCECEGSCYPAPEIYPLDDAALSPKNVFEQGKIKLPVNITLKDNVEQAIASESCLVESYQYQVNGQDAGSFAPDQKENFIPQCSLQPSAQYGVQAQACANGSCGGLSDTLSFSTNPGPELKSPLSPLWEEYDSGWTEEEKQENIASADVPTTLQWCPDPKAQSYRIEAEELVGTDPFSDVRPVLDNGLSSKTTQYTDGQGLQGNRLLKGRTYFWQIFSCPDSFGRSRECSASQRWNLVPRDDLQQDIVPTVSTGTTLNKTSALTWQRVLSASYFLVHIKELQEHKYTSVSDTEGQLVLERIWNELSLASSYTWQVAACGGELSANPENCKNAEGVVPWSSERVFHTTGAAPTRVEFSPVNDSGRVGTPTTVSWHFEQSRGVPGAASYAFEVRDAQNNVVASGTPSEPEAVVRDLRQENTYTLSVRTCADVSGQECGQAKQETFTIAALTSPIIETPEEGETAFIPTVSLKWAPVFGANAYEYLLRYTAAASHETDECRAQVGQSIAQRTLQTNTEVFSGMLCAGGYTLQVRACTSSQCSEENQETGTWEEVSFTAEELPGAAGGLIPCGRSANNPDTGWDDRKPCGIQHAFLLVQVLINFLLWKAAPLGIALAAIGTGVVWYIGTANGSANPLAETKRIWKAIGIGFAILLFSWLLINIVLGILGFDVGIFGNWYEI